MARHSDQVNRLNIQRDGSHAFLHRFYENRRFLGILPYRKQVRARAFYVPTLDGITLDENRYNQIVAENRADWNHTVTARQAEADRIMRLRQAMGAELV